MNKFLKVMFILLIIAMGSAAILQLFFPELMGSNSEYGTSIGWQREIAFWNLAILPILISINLKYDWFYLRVVLISLIIAGLGLGTNHLLGFIDDNSKIVSLIGALENYALVVCWGIGWKIEKNKQ